MSKNPLLPLWRYKRTDRTFPVCMEHMRTLTTSANRSYLLKSSVPKKHRERVYLQCKLEGLI